MNDIFLTIIFHEEDSENSLNFVILLLTRSFFLSLLSRVYWYFITHFSSTRDDISTNNFTISGRIISETDRVISIKFRLQSVNKGMFQMTLLWISLLCLSRKIMSVPQIVYCEVFGHLNDKTFCLTSYILSQSPHGRKIVQKYSPVIQSLDVIFNKWMPDTIKFVYDLKKISSNLFQNIFRSMKTLQRNSQKATNSSTTEVSYCISVRTKWLRTKLVKSGNLHS